MRFALVVSSVALLASSCRSTPVHVINERYRNALEERANHHRIKPGDVVSVKFFNLEGELNQTLTVLPDGRTDPFFMDNAKLAGLTVPELEAEINKYYAQQVAPTDLSIGVTPAGEGITLEGEVNRVAAIAFVPNLTLMQAIGQAGGYRLTACLHTVILRRSYLNPKHPEVFRVNLRDYADIPEELFLLPNDHIIVERNWVILVQDYIDTYVWGFLPPFLQSPLGFFAGAAF